jgi:hypothetical protein
MTSSVEDQDTPLTFFKRLLLSIIILDMTVTHLSEAAPGRGSPPTCSSEFECILAARFVFSAPGVTWNAVSELRSAIKLLNMYLKVCDMLLIMMDHSCLQWGPVVLLVRLFRFKYFRSSNYVNAIDEPLTRLWAKVMSNPDAVQQLFRKKKAASKILLRLVGHLAGERTTLGVRSILSRLDGFALAYQLPMRNSAKSLPLSNPVIDS